VEGAVGLLNEHPRCQRFRLTKDGEPAETVYLPLHVQRYHWVLLSGTGDARELAEVLALEDLDLAEMQPGGPNVGIFAIDYEKSDVGALREYYLIVAARERPIAGTIAPRRSLGFFVWDIQLDNDLAIRIGRQIWGYPKTVCAGEIDSKGSEFSFHFRETSGEPIMWGTCAGTANLAYEFVQYPPFFFITPYAIRRSWAEAINEGHTATKPFDALADAFGYNPETRLGSKLRRIEFRPHVWTVARDMSAVGLP
jgi:acetoacetate decarboxylase